MEGETTIKAVVLCAGHANRLYPFSDLIPKSMMPVGGKPVLRWIVERLERFGFTDIALCVNERDHPLFQDYFGDGTRFNINISYSMSPQPLGTVGEVLNARTLDDPSDFLLVYGDDLTQIDLGELLKTHLRVKQHGGVATLALVHRVQLDVGIVESRWSRTVETLKIRKFDEKPTLEKNIWAGIAMLDPKVLSYEVRVLGEDFGRDLFPRLLEEGYGIYGYKSDAEWYDVGTLSHYKRVCRLAEEGKL